MSKVLFVDACARGWEVSRTYAVAEAFMNVYREQHPRDEIEELTLAGLGLAYFTGKELEYRDALLARGGQADDYFKLARQFAAANKIVIAAPYWDLSFPALLKVYIERVSVSGITFSPEPDGRLRGLCRGEKMLLITTSGGDFTQDVYKRQLVRRHAERIGKLHDFSRADPPHVGAAFELADEPLAHAAFLRKLPHAPSMFRPQLPQHLRQTQIKPFLVGHFFIPPTVIIARNFCGLGFWPNMGQKIFLAIYPVKV